MPDKHLAGNGAACSACGGAGLVLRTAMPPQPWACPSCDGTGRVALPAAEILAAQLAANRLAPG